MDKLNLPESMSSDDRSAWDDLYQSATGKPKLAFDPEGLKDGITDMMAALGVGSARSRQIARKVERSLAVKSLEDGL